MAMAAGPAALHLYRALLRQSRQVVLSDRAWLKLRIRKEFELYRHVAQDGALFGRLIKRGQALFAKPSIV